MEENIVELLYLFCLRFKNSMLKRASKIGMNHEPLYCYFTCPRNLLLFCQWNNEFIWVRFGVSSQRSGSCLVMSRISLSISLIWLLTKWCVGVVVAGTNINWAIRLFMFILINLIIREGNFKYPVLFTHLSVIGWAICHIYSIEALLGDS